MTWLPRDTPETDALRTDRYLESLLVARDRRAADAPADPALDPTLRSAVARLERGLARVHPSFRFEERLARRLAEVAAAMRLPAAVGAEGRAVPVAPLGPGPEWEGFDPLGPVTDDGDGPGERGLPRPLLIGGAMASAALSLAGAAFVAWRLVRPPASPMARAVRAAHRARAASAAAGSAGPGSGGREGLA